MDDSPSDKNNEKSKVIRSVYIIAVSMVRIQSASKVWPGCLMVDSYNNDNFRNKAAKAVIIITFTSMSSQSSNSVPGAWRTCFTEQKCTSQAHVNCSDTMEVTFCNLCEEDETLDHVLETKIKRRRKGNNILIMFLKNLCGTSQHYGNIISLVLLIAVLVPHLRRGN